MDAGNGLKLELGSYQKKVNIRLKELHDQHFVKRLWNKENGLWMNKSQSITSNAFMGWLTVAEKMMDNLPAIEQFCENIFQSDFKYAVLLGMGGSSMAPMVFKQTFQESSLGYKTTDKKLHFFVLDTTDTETIKKVESEIDIKKTLFIVSSKSGGTTEVLALHNYFFSLVENHKKEKAGENFISITAEFSPLIELAETKRFRKVFLNYSDIGGRFSALSYFGLVPAALMGINIREILKRSLEMMKICGNQIPAAQNPGIILGAALAELAKSGIDKLTYVLPPSLFALGLWLEQLLAESTGKNGNGILPLNGLPLLEGETYGKDRVFLAIKLNGEKEEEHHISLREFANKGFPLITIQLKNELDIGSEFFRWEIATATIGAILKLNPFDQPNVQESKSCTDYLLSTLTREGSLPEPKPTLESPSGLYFSSSVSNVINDQPDAKLVMERFLYDVGSGDYIAIQAYLPEDEIIIKDLSEIQRYLQKVFRVAVTVEFGPRYLHSTGQYHKGGPNRGYFIQLIGDREEESPIPNMSYTFESLKRAQALGDMEALIKHERKVTLIDFGKGINSGLKIFKQVIKSIQPVSLTELVHPIGHTSILPAMFREKIYDNRKREKAEAITN